MELSSPQEFELPLELQFSMRRMEVAAQELTWDQLYAALLNLQYKRLMEWQAIKAIAADENIELELDFPTDLELETLQCLCGDDDEDEDDEESLQPF